MTACVVVSHVLLIWREHLSACQRGGSLMLFIGNHKSSSYSIPAHLWYSTCPTASRFVRHKAVCIQTQWTYCIFLHLWSQHVTVTATSACMWHVAVHCELKSPTPHTLQIHSCHCVTKTSFRPDPLLLIISSLRLIYLNTRLVTVSCSWSLIAIFLCSYLIAFSLRVLFVREVDFIVSIPTHQKLTFGMAADPT